MICIIYSTLILLQTKDICHIWELGGGALFTSVLVNGNSFTSYGPLSVVLMLDLSELGQLWNCMESLLDSIKRSLSLANQQIDELAQRICDDHPDRPFMDPFPTPLVIIGGKYDIFQEYEPEKRKIVCRCLRYISHVLCATLLFYSSKDAALVKRVKDVLNHHAFDAPLLKTTCQDYNKAVCVPCGSDLFESIEGVRTVTKHSLDKMRNFYTTHFPQAQKQITRKVFRPVNMPHIIGHGKNMDVRDQDHKLSTIGLVTYLQSWRMQDGSELKPFKLKWHVGWDHRDPRNENFLTFEFSFEYCGVNQIVHQFTYHQTYSVAQFWLV
ncbi:Cytoplasmic dynein 2 light intermediate chain 1 [Homalodisca vitripennis]|nr:Cytoplasmic dynein 2 light intermediate chain 1 [Homalodisca vitripennis]